MGACRPVIPRHRSELGQPSRLGLPSPYRHHFACWQVVHSRQSWVPNYGSLPTRYSPVPLRTLGRLPGWAWLSDRHHFACWQVVHSRHRRLTNYGSLPTRYSPATALNLGEIPAGTSPARTGITSHAGKLYIVDNASVKNYGSLPTRYSPAPLRTLGRLPGWAYPVSARHHFACWQVVHN